MYTLNVFGSTPGGLTPHTSLPSPISEVTTQQILVLEQDILTTVSNFKTFAVYFGSDINVSLIRKKLAPQVLIKNT